MRAVLRSLLGLLLVGAVSFTIASESQALDGFPQFQHVDKALDTSDLSYNPSNEIIFPSIIKASDYFANPLGDYYLYYAPHESPGGIALAYSDSLDGPWTEYGSNPIITNTWSPHYSVSHVSSPHVIWNEDEEKLFLYFHGENSVTRLASSTDGITFDYEQSVIGTTDFTGIGESSYARVFEYTIPSKNNKYIMLLMGNNGGTRKIYLAWSDDGRSWTAQQTPLISPNADEAGGAFGGGQLSGAHLFLWQGGVYVAYHSGSGNIHITEVGANFDQEDHLGVLYDSTAVDNNRAATPMFITENNTMYMFYTQGQRLATDIAYATADLGPSSSEWDLIEDSMDDYTQGWSTSGTTGSVTQQSGHVNLVDHGTGSAGSYYFLTKDGFTAPSAPFTYEVRAKVNAANTSNLFNVRSDSYSIDLVLTYGTSGTAKNAETSPSKTYTLDTTVYHDYRVVVHNDYSYDLYVDGMLAWSGASGSGSGAPIFKMGGSNTPTSSLSIDSVKLGSGEFVPATWDLIEDSMEDYTQGWSTSGTTGSVTQQSGHVNLVDHGTGTAGSYFFLTKDGFTAPSAPFTFEVRAKVNAANTSNLFNVRSGSYSIDLVLTHGTSGTAQNAETSPSKTYTLDTTVYHNYRVVVHNDYSYDLYVDGTLAWSGASGSGSGAPILKMGGSNAPASSLSIDNVKLGSGEILP